MKVSKEARVQRERIRKICTEWYDLMRLHGWTMTHEFVVDDPPNTNGFPLLAKIQPDWEYKHAHISWWVQTAAYVPDQEIEETFIHELMHLMFDGIKKSEERVATELARMFINVRNNTAASTRKPRKA